MTLNERFTLDAELGQGGMGTVYRATDQLLGRTVAIKFLKDSRTEEEAGKIRLEAQILARLVHDRIVRLYDFGESAGTYFLVMEEVNGSSFENRWRDLLLDERLRICAQVAEALHYAHIQGVIHRDVKPSNVLLTPGDEAKLSDFGLSRVIGDGKDRDGRIEGTPPYMSPEQAQGLPLDHRTDLYSVGVMLYECATGDLPFVGSMRSVMGQHKSAAPTPPRMKNPEIWTTLENLILSLLAKNPIQRPASGNVVALELYEEAGRAQRLLRINPGVRRADSRAPVTPPPSRTVTADGPKNAEGASANGMGSVDLESVMSSLTEAPPSAIPRRSDSAGATPSLPQDRPESSRASRAAALGGHDHPVARQMLAETLAMPAVVSTEERYLCGHYLAYLLGGARREGFLLRRPLDARNADRARLMLAMTWLACVGPTDEAIERASVLLDERPDVRAALTPVVVVKYLASRDGPAKNRWFRQVRKRLREASAYARKAMLDSKGVLNPGMMPRTLSDLALIAPPQDTLDAHRVSLWNRVADIWREEDEFRQAVLRYATRSHHRDAVSVDLWPEVVYPLIEHVHWQRTFRSRPEALWDYLVGKLLRVPVAGVRLDRMMIVAIPMEVAEQLDADLSTFVDDPQIDEDETSASEIPATPVRRPFYVGGVIPRDEVSDDDDEAPRVKVIVPLSQAEPVLFNQNVLRNLWEEAVEAQGNSTGHRVTHRTIPVGPYELAVVPTGLGRSAIRAGSAVRAILQGMQQRGKEIEIFTPSALTRDSASLAVIAVWIYQNASMAIAYVDFQHKERYILWNAPDACQINYDYAEGLRSGLTARGLEIPDRFDRVLSRK